MDPFLLPFFFFFLVVVGYTYKNTFQSYNYGLHIYSNVQIGDGIIPEIIFFPHATCSSSAS